MPSIDTFLQTAYQFIKALFVRVTKRMYRTAAVLMTGAAVVTVIAFNSVSFGGVGKNAASAHREYPDDVELTEMLQSEETTERAASMKRLRCPLQGQGLRRPCSPPAFMKKQRA